MVFLFEDNSVITLNSRRIPIRKSPDDITDVMYSHFEYGKEIGPALIDISLIKTGGVALDDKTERRRVDDLKRKILSDDGYIARIIIDQDGNVLEGQHRFSALSELGAEKIPVHIIMNLESGIDVFAMENAIYKEQPLHSDHMNQIVKMLLELLFEEKNTQKIIDEYDPPHGYAKAWNAGLAYLQKMGK